MSIHKSLVKADWKGGFGGSGTVRAPGFINSISLPTEFNGRGEGATPEDLFLAAAASCYLITFGIILDKAGVRYDSLTISAELLTQTGPAAGIQEIVLFPEIVTAADPAMIQRISDRVKDHCLIGKAIHPNVKTTINLKCDSRKTTNEMRGVI